MQVEQQINTLINKCCICGDKLTFAIEVTPGSGDKTYMGVVQCNNCKLGGLKHYSSSRISQEKINELYCDYNKNMARALRNILEKYKPVDKETIITN